MKTYLFAALLLTPTLAHAHTFLVKPEPVLDGKLPIKVLMTEKLFKGERLLEAKTVTLQFLSNKGAQPIELHADNEAKALVGHVAPPTGSGVLTAKTAPRYRAIEKGKQTSNPAETLRIEAFAKALVNPQAGNDGFSQRSGDRLELVPQNNPADLAAGKELVVLVLFDGKPIAAKVSALAPGQPRVTGNADDNGIARLTLPAAGAWVVRSGHHTDEKDDRSARYEASASLFLQID